MREIQYGAIQTVYRNTLFRSRLESRVAALLDLTGLLWDYESLDLKNYIPDFLVQMPFGPCLLECKPAVMSNEFKEPCRRITRSGWVGPALVVGSGLSQAPDGFVDLTLHGTSHAETGRWVQVGRGRWPGTWGCYPFEDVWKNWAAAGTLTRWDPSARR